jgi:ethanolamine ammonia-lyase large subunit
MEQFSAMIQTFQRKLCDKETIEDDAKEMQRKLLEVMTQEEIDELAQSKVAGAVKDLTPIERQLIVALAAEKKGNPLYNQRELEVQDVTARLSAEFANKVLLPGNDPSEQAEQSRQQDLETMALSAGHPMPVSPRDNHMIHLSELMPDAEQLAQQMLQGQFQLPVLEAVLAHVTEHYEQAVQQGVKPEMLTEVQQFVQKIGPHLAQLKEIEAQKEQLTQQAAALQNQDQPVPPTPPPDNVIPMQQ